MRIIPTSILCLLATFLFGQGATYVCHQEDIGIFALENINSKSIEFSPVFYKSGLVFVVAREKTRVFDPKTGQAYFDLMYADLGPGGDASKSVNFSPNIRTQYHEGPCVFSSDETEIFFTRSDQYSEKGKTAVKGEVQLKIYRATKGPDDWEQITELPFCSNTYSVAHPALSPDGQYLVFTSDMPGGFGGMDLYVVNRANGSWSDPVNLGSIINTKGNEVFPVWHQDGYLLFASDGHKGKGGLDLFVSAWNEEGNLVGLQHLDAPFNSSRDDLGLIVASNGKSGYFASNRKPTKGKDDLYGWTSPSSIFCPLSKVPDPSSFKELLVVDENESGIQQAYVWMIPMNSEGPSQYKEHFTTDLVPRNDKEGAFYLKWGVTDTLSIETANAISDIQGKVNLQPDKKTTYILVAQHNGYEHYAEVVPGGQFPSNIRLKKLKTVTPPCIRTLFTVYNATGDLVLNGAKITLTGSCLKSIITSYTDENGSMSYCLPSDCTIKSEIMQEGYASHAFSFKADEEDEHWKVYLKSSEVLTAPPSPISTGTVIVLDNIYYDFNKSVIREGEAGELIALANVLKQYPDLTIELTSHTDTRGSAEYNMELSKRRSESSKSFLVLSGVSASRIITKAAGESIPRNRCLNDVPCTEAEHQYNRRTEVRITNPAEGMVIKYKAAG